MKVTFWGTRGSTACATDEHNTYGGHTACVTVEVAGQLFIFDSGTGIYDLNKGLNFQDYNRIDLFFSHVHIDHIIGLPFFQPIWNTNQTIHLWAGHLGKDKRLVDALAGIFTHPYFPIPVKDFPAILNFHDFNAGETFEVPNNINMQTIFLNHPGGSTGYRLNFEGKSFCYITDNEHVPGNQNTKMIEFIRETDLMIYDATFTEDEFQNKKGWGHSTPEEGIRLAKAGNVKKLALFHHAPEHNDNELLKIEQKAQEKWQEVFLARQGESLTLS